jgi:hypothetical protein
MLGAPFLADGHCSQRHSGLESQRFLLNPLDARKRAR